MKEIQNVILVGKDGDIVVVQASQYPEAVLTQLLQPQGEENRADEIMKILEKKKEEAEHSAVSSRSMQIMLVWYACQLLSTNGKLDADTFTSAVSMVAKACGRLAPSTIYDKIGRLSGLSIPQAKLIMGDALQNVECLINLIWLDRECKDGIAPNMDARKNKAKIIDEAYIRSSISADEATGLFKK